MDEVRRVVDPDGREVVFDHGSWLHLAAGDRKWLLDHVDVVMSAVVLPDHGVADPRAGRERFYTRPLVLRGRWLRVIVDYTDSPAWIVTACIDNRDPRSYLT